MKHFSLFSPADHDTDDEEFFCNAFQEINKILPGLPASDGIKALEKLQ